MRSKYLLPLILATMVLVIASLALPACATVKADETARHLDNVNAHIYREIESAIKKADKAILSGNTDEVDEIILNLQTKAASLVEKALEWAERRGIPAVHFDIEVLIGGRIVLVDPIHVLW